MDYMWLTNFSFVSSCATLLYGYRYTADLPSLDQLKDTIFYVFCASFVGWVIVTG
jgi:hypothetical protein